jgi:hypothetical protein
MYFSLIPPAYSDACFAVSHTDELEEANVFLSLVFKHKNQLFLPCPFHKRLKGKGGTTGEKQA